MFRRFEPEPWNKEGRGVYVSPDGLSMVRKEGNRWVPSVRGTVDEPWQETGAVYMALHAAQSCCNRTHQKMGV